MSAADANTDVEDIRYVEATANSLAYELFVLAARATTVGSDGVAERLLQECSDVAAPGSVLQWRARLATMLVRTIDDSGTFLRLAREADRDANSLGQVDSGLTDAAAAESAAEKDADSILAQSRVFLSDWTKPLQDEVLHLTDDVLLSSSSSSTQRLDALLARACWAARHKTQKSVLRDVVDDARELFVESWGRSGEPRRPHETVDRVQVDRATVGVVATRPRPGGGLARSSVEQLSDLIAALVSDPLAAVPLLDPLHAAFNRVVLAKHATVFDTDPDALSVEAVNEWLERHVGIELGPDRTSDVTNALNFLKREWKISLRLFETPPVPENATPQQRSKAAGEAKASCEPVVCTISSGKLNPTPTAATVFRLRATGKNQKSLGMPKALPLLELG